MGYNIIEFNGLPGCGKSTLVRELSELLLSEGFVTVTDKDVFKKMSRWSKALELVRPLFNLKFIKFNILVFILGFMIFLKNYRINYLIRALTIIRYNGLLYNLILKNKQDYILMSEGFVQFLYSLLDNTDGYKSHRIIYKIVHEIIYHYPNMLIVNCTLDIITAINRVRSRDGEPNSVDLMDESVLYRFMEQRDHIIRNIRQILDCGNVIKINMEESIKKNLDLLMSEIIGRSFVHET